jgi:hypothetical protein
MDDERVMKISHLRDNLGWACQQVAQTEEPIIVKRYRHKDVAIVPLWEWQFFKQLEAQIKDGRCPVGREKGEACPCSSSKWFNSPGNLVENNIHSTGSLANGLGTNTGHSNHRRDGHS